jgi:hypothetical protein
MRGLTLTFSANPSSQAFIPKYATGYATSDEIEIRIITSLDKRATIIFFEAPNDFLIPTSRVLIVVIHYTDYLAFYKLARARRLQKTICCISEKNNTTKVGIGAGYVF